MAHVVVFFRSIAIVCEAIVFGYGRKKKPCSFPDGWGSFVSFGGGDALEL